MKVKTIVIKTPTHQKDCFRLHLIDSKAGISRKTIKTTLSALKRNIRGKGLVMVKVVYPDKSTNQTISSNDIDYLVNTTRCFLKL
ncbi:MAG: hypothetical protein KatS3mg101_0995 [Patescibacteria group bacterium]|nr:MAG: hypothetical protein KatS3mg101_0995 [Patescibacteria group bacterium]